MKKKNSNVLLFTHSTGKKTYFYEETCDKTRQNSKSKEIEKESERVGESERAEDRRGYNGRKREKKSFSCVNHSNNKSTQKMS